MAVSRVALTNVVVRATPFHSTDEVLVKFVPLIVKVKLGPPARPVVGDSDVTVGTGLGVTMVSVTGAEVLPAKLPSPE